MSKVEIVKVCFRLGVPFKNTYSCYYGEELSCGECDSCRIRLQAFHGNNMVDPVKYKNPVLGV